MRHRKSKANRTKYFKPGDWNVVCDVTGFVRKRSECKLTWDNLLVTSDQWDEKHPQLTIRGRKDKQSVPIARPESDPVFTSTTADDL